MDSTPLRNLIYTLLGTLTLGLAIARVIGSDNTVDPGLYRQYKRVWPATQPEPYPTFSSNDRSRWATIYSLVEEGTFVIGKRVDDPTSKKGYRDEGVLFTDGFKTVDNMMNPQTREFYSTKPPLMTCAMAGEYWLLKQLFGWHLMKDRWEVVCTILITFNVIPFGIYLLVLARVIDRLGTSDWGKIFVFASACVGTFLMTFMNTINNHLPAAFCILFAVAPLLKPRLDGKGIGTTSILISGFFASLAACLDLPAASFAGLMGLWILYQSRNWKNIFPLILAAAIPIGMFFTTNYQALGEFNIGYSKFGTEWYNYDGSHWNKQKEYEEGKIPKPRGIDFASETKQVYAFHLTFGHHGLFSLTPVFLLSLIGVVILLQRSNEISSFDRTFALIWILSFLVVFAFYVKSTNNYGGWTSGPRWLFWFTPLFLIAMIPAADSISRSKWLRGIALLFLLVSVFSAFYPLINPWRHPWILQLCEYLGWINY
jgi:hypothetical protein